MREKSGWSGGRQMQMMDTFASRQDQRAALAFASIGVLVLLLIPCIARRGEMVYTYA